MTAAFLALSTACAAGNKGATPTKPGESGAPAPVASYVPPKISLGTAEDSKGPAPAPEGVVKGGTVTMVDQDDLAHLDPAQQYVNTETNAGLMLNRALTGYKRVGKGDYKLVGDLAVDTGKPS